MAHKPTKGIGSSDWSQALSTSARLVGVAQGTIALDHMTEPE